MLDRRRFLFLAGAGAVLTAAPAGGAAAAEGAAAVLEAELRSGRPCPAEATAIRRTLARMASVRPPRSGRTIVADIPSQTLSCYEGPSVVLQSRIVVGETDWQTPDLDTAAAFVRFNPTWTVPESILRARRWRDKLAGDPDYFARLNFEVELDGRLTDPRDAASRASGVGRFVQRPGPGNALGEVKIGLAVSNAIYLHDTNDRSKFDGDLRALSHGCMRVEEALAVAAWVLGITDDEAASRVDRDDRTDYRSFPSPVRVTTTYFTAWPDDAGTVRYYPDVYGRDGTGSRYCSESASRTAPDPGYADEAPAEIIYEEETR